jgi:5-methylcytosine-specific restriction enzyme subunit McrC
MRTTITLFERQERLYAELGWEPDHTAIEQLELLNQANGAELVRLGRKHLRATQYVGVARIGEITLQILPKIDFAGDPEAEQGSIPYQAAASSATKNLLHLLSYTQDLKIREQEVSPLLDQSSDWFELLTRLLATNLHHMMKRGVDRTYVQTEESIPLIRGRWLLSRQLTRRPHLRHMFDVVYDEFLADSPLNQVFRFVVERLLLSTQNGANRRLMLDVREWLAEVQLLGEIPQAHLEGVHFTRLNDRFRPAFNLARLFLENQIPQLAVGRRETFAFVFDMERLFEEFVFRFIAQHRRVILPEAWQNTRIRAQSRGRQIYLAKRLPGHKPVFRLFPDIAFVRPSGKTFLILDTKYKWLDPKRHRLGVSEGDIYQMLAYATRLNCPQTLLLYPQWAGASKTNAQFMTQGYPARLSVATLNLRQPLNRPQNLVGELRDILQPLSSPILEEVVHDGAVSRV